MKSDFTTLVNEIFQSTPPSREATNNGIED